MRRRLLFADLSRPELEAVAHEFEEEAFAEGHRAADGLRDDGILPLQVFVDEPGPDGCAIAVEMAADGTMYPAVYLRKRNRVTEHPLSPHPLHDYETEAHRRALSELVGPLLGST